MSNLHATFLAFLVISNVWAAAGRWWEAGTWLAFAAVALVASIVVARRALRDPYRPGFWARVWRR